MIASTMGKSRLFRQAGRGVVALADQASSSGTTFLVNILLARLTSPESFGGFAYAWSLFMFGSTIHNVLLLEPMAVIGPSRHDHQLPALFRTSAKLHALWGLGVALLAALGGLALTWIDRSSEANALFGLALGQIGILYYWLVRRAKYVEGDPKGALYCTLIYSVLTLLALFVLATFDFLSSFSAFAAMGAAGLLGGLRHSSFLRYRRFSDSQSGPTSHAACPLSVPEVARSNWRYGRWLILSSILYWLSNQAYFVLTTEQLDSEQTAGLKAIHLLVLPMNQFAMALGLLFLPSAARQFAGNGKPALVRHVFRFTALLTAVAVTYWTVISLAGTPLIELLYDGQYSHLAQLIPLMALQPLLIALSSPWVSGLRVMQQTSRVFLADGCGALATVTLGVWLIATYSLPGAIAGMLISIAARLPVLAIIWLFFLPATAEPGGER